MTMLDLRRLRLLHELHARGTIAAVADALQFTPSAVSQQLAVLEREAGLPLLERGRPRRAADRRGARARRPRRRAARARRARRGRPGGRRRPRRRARPDRLVPVGRRCGSPCRRCRRSRARRPRLRCELIEAEPEQSLPALALGDVDLVLADEWQHQPLARPRRRRARGPAPDPVHVVLPAGHPAARRHATPCRWPSSPARPGPPATAGRGGRRSPSAPAASSAASTPTSATAPTTASLSLALVADGQAVTLLPELVAPGAPRRRRGARRSPRARCTARSSPRPAPPTPSGRRSRRCWPPSAPPPASCTLPDNRFGAGGVPRAGTTFPREGKHETSVEGPHGRVRGRDGHVERRSAGARRRRTSARR